MAREYNISKTACLCRSCQKHLEPGSELVATVREAGEELQREDFCLDCWSARPQQADHGLLGSWHSRVPASTEKKKLLVDDELLVNLFQRLEHPDTAAKANFRFVLALILMRKKLLVYDRTEAMEGQETWVMHLRGDDTPV
ncbi:MAG: hypothetical protein MUP47_10695 [Phycisphaerae bacterium]|nr:hypothetical protein [Phycisphaerae bacterium]